MINRFLALAGVITLSLWNLSFQWPVTDPRISSSFGESRWDHFHDGVDVTSTDMSVRPVAPGRLLFYWDKLMYPLENYPGSGNYRIISHDGGLYSIYMHLEDGGGVKGEYGAGDTLGVMGNTGHSFGKHLHFGVFKLAENTSLNPFPLLPAVEDKKAPVLFECAVRIGDRYFPVKKGTRLRLTQHYPFLIMIQDSIQGRERLGVTTLTVEMNQRKVYDATFAEITMNGPSLTVQGKSFSELYDEKGYYRVASPQYNNGSNTVRIHASDFAGNETTEEITFDINLDIK